MKKQIHQTVIELKQGDITEISVDAIVNAANSQLLHGGGVAGAIVRKGGEIIQEESRTWVTARGPVPTGSCAITSAGRLPARYIIHAVGPRMGEGNEDEKLAQATKSALEMAEKHNLTSIAFPAISTGVFGYPLDRCAKVMLYTVMEYIKKSTGLKHVLFCLYDTSALEIFKTTFLALLKEEPQ